MGIHPYRLGVIAIALLLSGCAPELSTESLQASSLPTADKNSSPPSSDTLEASQIEHRIYRLTDSTIQVVTVPADSDYQIKVAVADTLTPLKEMAEQAGAIAAINAGFFDPQNGLTTSYITIDGSLVADPQQNERLVGNPDLQPYLASIFNRSEFRIYRCEDGVRYDITVHGAPVLAGCDLTDAVGAGPQLLPTITGYEEGFLADNAAGDRVRDAISSQSPHARSIVGLRSDGAVVFAIAQQLATVDTSSGLNLQDFADFLQGLGLEQALNLDGGSSTGLYFEGTLELGRLDEQGDPIERPIKSILLVR